MKSDDVIRELIQDKLSRGELAGDECSKVLGGSANGEICDACGDRVVPPQLVMECIGDHYPRAIVFHVLCFYLWDAARRARGAGPGSCSAR
jgi:hypothetical protein